MPQIPWRYTSVTATFVSTDQVLPFVSPLISFRTSAQLKKRIQLDAALQYQMTGEKYHFKREGSFPHRPDLPIDHYYKDNRWEDYRFHKLALPITMTLLFKKDRMIRPAFVLGYRANYFLAGSFEYSSTYEASDKEGNEPGGWSYDPLDKNTMHTPLNRFYSQMVLGMSANIQSKWKLELAGNLNFGLMYAAHEGCWGGGDIEHISGTDLTCSLTYYLTK